MESIAYVAVLVVVLIQIIYMNREINRYKKENKELKATVRAMKIEEEWRICYNGLEEYAKAIEKIKPKAYEDIINFRTICNCKIASHYFDTETLLDQMELWMKKRREWEENIENTSPQMREQIQKLTTKIFGNFCRMKIMLNTI